jgi:hypothetical protein
LFRLTLLGIGQALQDVPELRTFAHTQTFVTAEETQSTRKNCPYKKIVYSGRERLNEAPSEVLRYRVLSVYSSLNPFGHRTVEFQCIDYDVLRVMFRSTGDTPKKLAHDFGEAPAVS